MPSLASYRLIKRHHILNQPVQSLFAKKMFRTAFLRLRGLFLLTHIIREVKLYGASSRLTNPNRKSYNRNLATLLTQKQFTVANALTSQKSLYLFYPNQLHIKLISAFSAIALLLSITFEPYAIGFLEESLLASSISMSIDVIFSTEILTTFNLAYYDDEHLISDRKAIIKNYLSSSFALDLMTVFPFYLISTSDSNQLFGLLRIFRLLKLLKARKLIDFLSKFKDTNLKILSKKIQENLALVRLCGFLLIVFFLLHISACIWHFVARFEDNEPETWITKAGLTDKSDSQRYLASLYFSITILTTVGYGDIKAITYQEKIFTVLWLFFGVGLYSFFISSINSLLTASSTRRATLNEKLLLYSMLSKDMKLDDELHKVIAAVAADDQQTTLLSFKQRCAAIRCIPKALRAEVALSAYDGAIEHIPFLRRQNLAFYSNIVPLLKYRRVEENTWIYNKGEFAEEIFFVVKGRINYCINNFIFKTMVQGAYFGEIEVFESTSRTFGVSTEVDTELMVMDLDVSRQTGLRDLQK